MNFPVTLNGKQSNALFLKLILFHGLISILFYLIFTRIFSFSQEFSEVAWDIGFYLSIKQSGYDFTENNLPNVAFFPLFPYLWKVTNVGFAGIRIINGILLCIGSFIIYKCFKPDFKILLLFLALPSAFFFYIPYSESVFFITGAILLAGFYKNNPLVITIGIILSVFSRSAASVFVPALSIIFFILIYFNRKTDFWYLFYILVSAGTFLLVLYIQYFQTGDWQGYFKAQAMWGHRLQVPHLPFICTFLRPYDPLVLDTAALFAGAVSLFMLSVFLWKKFRNKIEMMEYSVAELFSLLYLIGISLSMLLFQSGDLHSLNRYIFASPYFLIFMISLYKKPMLNSRQIFWVILILTGFGFLSGTYKYFELFWRYAIATALIAGTFYINDRKFSMLIFILVYLSLLFFQVYFYSFFYHFQWVA